MRSSAHPKSPIWKGNMYQELISWVVIVTFLEGFHDIFRDDFHDIFKLYWIAPLVFDKNIDRSTSCTTGGSIVRNLPQCRKKIISDPSCSFSSQGKKSVKGDCDKVGRQQGSARIRRGAYLFEKIAHISLFPSTYFIRDTPRGIHMDTTYLGSCLGSGVCVSNLTQRALVILRSPAIGNFPGGITRPPWKPRDQKCKKAPIQARKYPFLLPHFQVFSQPKFHQWPDPSKRSWSTTLNQDHAQNECFFER